VARDSAVNGDRYVTWKQVLVLLIPLTLGSISLPITVSVFLLEKHEDSIREALVDIRTEIRALRRYHEAPPR